MIKEESTKEGKSRKYQGEKRDRKNIHFENSHLSAFTKFIKVEHQIGNTT